ncbi:MAG TPA: type II toxin-antitoxin system VapC family toxin [Solirubrobacteraceae bacterium]
MRFWDSSAVVPLIVAQAASAQADSWLSDDPELALWTLTAVELTSALRRLVREGLLAERDANAGEARVDELVQASHLVVNVDVVKSQARRLLRLHSLRAADAMQLGAALEWAAGRPTGRLFVTLDAQLGRAAAREGFRVIPGGGE